MKIKATIRKDTKAYQIFTEYREQKAAFRKAAQEGRAEDFIRKKPEEKIAQPV